ncbi:MAG: hypothetical protein AAB436_00700 [Patescibacteria group bacterium]
MTGNTMELAPTGQTELTYTEAGEAEAIGAELDQSRLATLGGWAMDQLQPYIPQSWQAKAALMLGVGSLGAAVSLKAAPDVFANNSSNKPAGLIGRVSGTASIKQVKISASTQPFKKCKKNGKPKIQMQIVGPEEITDTDSPTHYDILLKSCKKLKKTKTEETYSYQSQNRTWKTNLKPRKVKTYGFDVQFAPSPIDASGAYDDTCVAQAVRLTVSQGRNTGSLYNGQLRVPYSGQAACENDSSTQTR